MGELINARVYFREYYREKEKNTTWSVQDRPRENAIFLIVVPCVDPRVLEMQTNSMKTLPLTLETVSCVYCIMKSSNAFAMQTR